SRRRRCIRTPSVERHALADVTSLLTSSRTHHLDRSARRRRRGRRPSDPEPPALARKPGRDAVTVAVMRPATVTPTPAADPDPANRLVLPAIPTASGIDQTIGAVEAPPGPSTSRGPGSGPGTGSGVGGGDGPGRGDGLGDGLEAGSGGGVYRLGGS